jgi:hypothetical protein
MMLKSVCPLCGAKIETRSVTAAAWKSHLRWQHAWTEDDLAVANQAIVDARNLVGFLHRKALRKGWNGQLHTSPIFFEVVKRIDLLKSLEKVRS